jgi:phage portal protein BeeE
MHTPPVPSLRGFLRGDDPGPWSLPAVAPPVIRGNTIETIIGDAIAERGAAFTLADALELPSVVRGRALISSLGALMVPQLIRDGIPADDQPRIVRRPDPFAIRGDFVSRTITGLIDHGEAFWRVGDRDQDGYARFATVLVRDEVTVSWDERRWQRKYQWRGQDLVHGQDLIHVALDLGPGDLHGHGPLSPDRGLPALATAYKAELYAATFYGSGGVPETVLKTAAKLSAIEADTLATQWAEARARGQLTGRPAVASGGLDPVFPGMDPEKAQLQATRDYGNTVAARLLGIPAALLHVATSGASITYANAQAAVDELVKATLVPLYLAPVEAWWSDLVPRTSAVRFNLGELVRADIVTRWQVYTAAHAMDALSPEEARQLEGWSATVNSAAMQPTPAPVQASQAPLTEVPAA